VKAKLLYKQLDSDFELDKLKEDWSWIEFNEYYSEIFKQRFMGLVLDNAEEITRIFTAVFPSDSVLNWIIGSGEMDVLLLTHHPVTWVSTEKDATFLVIPQDLLAILKARKVALYTLHAPLDKVGPYSTGMTLANAIEVVPDSSFCEYHGVNVGVIGATQLTTVTELAKKVESAVGHIVKVWNYGSEKIRDQRVAIVAGGGNFPEVIKEIVEAGLNTYVTGITKKSSRFPDTLKFHEAAEKEGINVIAATHYSTEKFACIAMLDYFDKLGLNGQFIEDSPLITDYD
jgi:putative NIF3 family GTP cyclohydrolase 1 type 2